MRNFKKFLAAAIAGVMLTAAMCFGASAAKFTDVNAKDEVLSEAVDLLVYLNVTKGTTETTFGTNENVTRQQMAAFIYRLMKKGASMEGGENSTTFTDLKDSTYFSYVSWANAMGIIKGRSNTVFDPTGTITLQEAYTMVIRALGYDDTDFNFPVDYNDLAETEELALDAGIPSGFSYETPLTRGAVAIILRNAFFAETGYVETEYEERELGSADDNTLKAVLVEKEYHPTLAEYVYDVIQGEFRVVATPRNSFNENKDVLEYKPLYEDFQDVDMLHFISMDDDEKINDFYYDFSKLGLNGKADDYIMGEFEIFYTVDKDEKLDKIYYAGNSMKHESTSDVKFVHMTPDTSNKWHYYEAYFNESKKEYVLHKPYISVAGNNIYLFDAPYSYLKPNFGSATDEDTQYLLKNEENAKLIGMELLDSEEGTYSYYIKDSFGKGDYKKFIQTFSHAAYGGITKCDIYDVNGDGLYDYIRYRPYTFGQMEGDERYTFNEITEHESNKPVYLTNKSSAEIKPNQIPTIYYNDATLTGVKFNDGDFVIAHLDTEANEIDVFKVVDKVQGYISGVNASNYRITLGGKSYSGVDVDKMFVNYMVGGKDRDSDGTPAFKHNAQSLFHKDQKLYSAYSIDKEYILYTYNGKILFYELLEEAGAVYNKDSLIIPLEAGMHDENDAGFFEGKFNTSIADNIYYIKAWVNNTVKFVPVSIAKMYPTPTKWGETRNFNDAGVLGKICNYTIDENGIYNITSLLYAEDENGKFIGINHTDPTVLKKDDTTEYFANDLGNERVAIKKVIANRFKLTDITDEENSLLGTDAKGTVDSMVLTDSTYILIRSEKAGSSADDKFNDRYEYLEFDVNTFVNSVAVATDENGINRYLENVQYVLRNDPDNDDRAYLEFLYAETYDFDFVTKKVEYTDRILLDTYADVDADGYYRNYYDILNPYTGKVEEKVAGTKRFADASSLKEQFATVSGKVVKVDSTGKIDETYKSGDEITLTGNHHFAFVTDYAEKDKLLEIVPVNDADGENGGYYDAGAYYEVDEDTTVMLVKYAKNSNSLYDAEFSDLTIADLAAGKKDIKCYNSKMIKPGKDTYNTEYAEYVKCYVIYEDAKKSDDYPKAKAILVIVHDNEDKELLDLPATYNE